ALKRDSSRSPLFDVMVVLQNQRKLQAFQSIPDLEELQIERYQIERSSTQFDLSFEFTQEEDDSLVVEVNYNTDIYAGGFIETMIRNLEVFIKNALSDPTQDIGKVKMMNPAQEEQLLTAYHGPEVSFPTNKTAIDLFEDQVKANPQHMAISYSGMEYSYQRLQEEANKLANYVQAQHALQTEDLVVVMLERSDWLIISLLAVWKLGGAYVPVDPTYPEERIDYIIDDANAKLLIDSSFIDTYQNSNHEESTTPERNLLSSNLAYVIYTSGSTGNPKGVMINHSSLVNLCSWHQRTYQVDATSRGAMYSGIAFDASVWEIYPYLLAGACLFPIGDDAVRLDLKKLVAFYHSNKISHTYLPTRICRDLLDAQVELPFTTVLTGGEALRYEGTPSFKVFNNYGPTENTVVTTYFNCDNELGSNVPIGKPIDNVKAYVLSNFDLLQPIGVVGELCVSGAGISRGYLHKTTMTAACFQPSPFDSDDKIYRTGDLVRWLPTGNLEFMGRKDHQVKIRGYRIELGEIETVLQQHPGLISQAVVTVQEIKQEDHLVAYYVSDVTHQAAELRAFLQTRLPDYMVPGYYQALESIPLTSNGKVDKDQLPKVAAHRQVGNLYVAPGTPTEMKVLEIWQEHLEEPQIGMNDDFFELGGHSLLLTKLINSYQQVFEVSIDLKAVYTHTTPKAHAGLIANSDDASLGKIEVVPTSEYYQVSPSQERFWLLYKFKGASREFNIFSELRLPGTLDVNAFQKAFKRLVERHEALRTSFVEVDGIPMQKIAVASQVTIPVYDFENKDEAQDSVHSHEFDLDAAPLYRVALLDGPKGAVLYFSMHHIISDGWSMQLLGKQLMADYIAIRSGKAIVNDAPEVQYKDYAAWKKQLLSDPLMDVQRLYWKEQLAGEIPYLPLPYDHAPKHKTNTTESGYHKMYLESQSMDAIVAVLRDNRVSEFSFFLATLSILLRRLTQQEDILIGIPVANRNHYQLKDVVGCFLNTLMIRNRVQADKAFDGYLEEVNAVIMEALAHQNYPFEKLLEDLSVPKDHDRFPLSPVFLNMSEFEARVTERLDDFSTHAGTIDATPKFDLECYLKRFENGYELNCVFNAERFMPETIAYWMEAWLDIVAQALQQPARSLNSFSIFDTAMATVEDPKPSNEFEFFSAKEIEQSIVSRFEAQVAKVPENTAVSGSSGAYTYYELNAAANGVALQILEGTKQTSARVALLLDHDATCVIGMLAALKAGYSYVPIDINNPNQRIEFIVNDASCEMIVCTERTLEKAKAIQERLPDVGLVVFSAEDRAADTPNLDITIAPKKEAYVLYTSGSTGNPKGVVQIHRNVMHYIRVYTNATHICSEDRLSLFSTYTFDASVKDIFGALLNGARVCLYNVLQEGTSRLPEWLSEEKITIIHMVPTLFRFVMSELKEDTVLEHVRLIDMGGEASFRTDFELFKKHFRKGALYVNDYGPTEATIVSQKFLSHDSSNTRTAIPVGRSVTGTDVFLWDEHQNTKGIYEEGEIIFRSDFLSLGYLNRTEQTSRVFIPDPDDPSKRLYRSGDIGRMLPSGEIEFLQRKDSLVKLNGMRIELSEIEARMERLEPIMKAVVLVKKVQEQEFLTAYITKLRH
ncbi:MAG: amino acid adenylation domain-containing protein, partial [Bacteroidota bacterium]